MSEEKERKGPPSAYGLALGCSLGMLIFAECLVLVLQGWDEMAARIAILPALVPWLIVGWVKGRSMMRALVWELEEATGLDINQDGDIGHGHHFVYVGPEASLEKQDNVLRDMRFFVDGCYGSGTSFEAWRDKRLPSGQKVTQKVWRPLCDAIVQARCGHLDGKGQLVLDVGRETVYGAFGL